MVEYNHDPVVMYPNELVLLQASIVEVSIRKTMHDFGFNQEEFTDEFPYCRDEYSARAEAFEYFIKAMNFVGYPITLNDLYEILDNVDNGREAILKIEIPELAGINEYMFKTHTTEWQGMLNKWMFFGEFADATIVKEGSKVFIHYDIMEESFWSWMAVADMFFNFLTLVKNAKEVLGIETHDSIGGRKVS